MSYDRFLAAIKEPALIDLAAHWNAARGEHSLPAWGDIDAVALRRLLPFIWAWRYDAARQTYIGRLAGEEVTAVVGVNVRNRAIEDCFSAAALPVIRARLDAVRVGPSVMYGNGTVYVRHGYTGSGERIILPLASDHQHADGVIGATYYRFAIKPATGEAIAFDPEEETIEFFPLGG